MKRAIVGNAADEEQVKSAGFKERRTRADELRDLSQFILNTRAGRKYIWELMEFCGITELSYTRGDAMETCFREGSRNVGNKILIDVTDANPDLLALMKKENTEDLIDARASDVDNGTSSEG